MLIEQKVIYQKNINAIKNILTGKNKKFIQQIKTPSEIIAVEKIYEHSPYLNISKYQNIEISKIECYDISNFAGKEAVGAMTLFRLVKTSNKQVTLIAETSSWRKFKIRSIETRNDPEMISEILIRRLNHPEWPYPNLIIINGGITQYNAAKKVLKNALKPNAYRLIPLLISFAKPQKKIYGIETLPPEQQKEVVNLLKERIVERIIGQTHNFVIRYHQYHRQKKFLPL